MNTDTKLGVVLTMMARGYEWRSVTRRLAISDDVLRDLLRRFCRDDF